LDLKEKNRLSRTLGCEKGKGRGKEIHRQTIVREDDFYCAQKGGTKLNAPDYLRGIRKVGGNVRENYTRIPSDDLSFIAGL